eukprot:5891158-Pyramimonas_sp.AAC.1
MFDVNEDVLLRDLWELLVTMEREGWRCQIIATKGALKRAKSNPYKLGWENKWYLTKGDTAADVRK